MTSNIKSNLIDELKDALDSLDRKKYPKTAISFKDGDEEIFYTRREFNSDYYSSLVYSGRLDELLSLIQPIQDIFNRLIQHNYYLRKAMDIEDISKETIPFNNISYFKWMDSCEKILLKDIPKMIKSLQQ